MAFGPRPGDLAAFDGLGSSDRERLERYVEQQLNPEAIDDSGCEARLAAAGFTTLHKSRTQMWADHVVNYVDSAERQQPMRELERAVFVRALYSRRQLVEVLADFWHNHFNVYGLKYPLYSMIPCYDMQVIRRHQLGNFFNLLEAVAQSVCMLYYLDNYASSNAGPNENYARELFELHTLGAEHYYGVGRQSSVPLDDQGRPLGYVDDDVYEATRCLTGWTIRDNARDPAIGSTGEFYLREDWHDRFQKTVLGRFIPPGQAPLLDGLTVLRDLANHPGTAHYLCRKLVRRLVADDPPEALVQSAAAVFGAAQEAPDQLKQVVRHILLSEAFATTWGHKIKRPFEVAVSALRAGDADFVIMRDEADSNSFMSLYGLLGQPPFQRVSPDGYPDLLIDWSGTTSLVMRWRLVSWLIDVKDDAERFRLDVLGATPPEVRTPNALVDFWMQRVFGYALPAPERQELVDFLAQGRNPDYDLPLGVVEVQDRLRALVGLIFMSPAFQWR